MPDLVAEHAGELGLRVQIGQDPARDVDIAAREREGVDDRIIEHREVPLDIGEMGHGRQPPADGIHVGRNGRILIDPILGHDRLMALPSHR